MLRVFVIGIAAMIAFAPSASAQDPSAQIVPYNWTGFYGGLSFGYGLGQRDSATLSGDPLLGERLITGTGVGKFAPSSISSKLDGFVGGALVGYNRQHGSVVVGLEADFSASNADDGSSTVMRADPPYDSIGFGPFTTSSEEKLRWLGTVRGRLGYLARSDLLLFATGGLAYGSVEEGVSVTNNSAFTNTFGFNSSFVTCLSNVPCFSGSTSETRLGWTVGGGFEWALTPNTTFRTEYLYVDLGDAPSLTLAPKVATPDAFMTARFADVQENIIRGALSFKF
jgi:outer membrane immunogenic protein